MSVAVSVTPINLSMTYQAFECAQLHKTCRFMNMVISVLSDLPLMAHMLYNITPSRQYSSKLCSICVDSSTEFTQIPLNVALHCLLGRFSCEFRAI